MVAVERYDAHARPEWDRFVAASRNGTFLFQRSYMDYHSDRFTDHSLVFREGERVLAVLPASQHDRHLISHGGLTYGGVISGQEMKTAVMLEVFAALAQYARAAGLTRLVYKRVPFIYHHVPAEEDLYALFRSDATLVRRDVSSAVAAGAGIPYTKGRQYCVNKSGRQGLTVGRSEDFAAFMLLEEKHLQKKFGVRPVHSPDEMTLLASRFPDNIKLFTATKDDRLAAGVIIYESRQVAHAQYIAATDAGKEASALDAILDHLLSVEYRHKPYFDFGISTKEQGRSLNEGLIGNKESYGSRAIVYDTWELQFSPGESVTLPTIDDCKVVELPKIPDFRGSLSFVESSRHVPFQIVRTYWIYDVPGDSRRGGHAYRQLEEFMIALSGSFDVRLDDGRSTRTIRLSRSYFGLYVPRGVWRELTDFSTNSVCLILAARRYEEADYIRDYDDFLAYRENA